MSNRRRDRASEEEPAKSDERTGADPEETNQPSPPGGSLQWGSVREPVQVFTHGAYFCSPPAFCPEMDAKEWLKKLEDFFRASGVPTTDYGAIGRYVLTDPMRCELYPAGQATDDSFEELKERLLNAYGLEESPGMLIDEARTNAKASPSSNSPRRWQSWDAGPAYQNAILWHVSAVEGEFQERQQPRAGIAKPEKTEMAQQIDAMIREMGNLAKKVEQLERTTPRPSRTAPGCFRCGSLDHLRRDCPQLRTRTRPALAPNNGNGDRQAAGGSILLSDGRRVRLCGQGTLPLQVVRWRGRIHVAVVESLVVPGILGTNFLDQYVELIDWQAGKMTMTDGSRVRIIHEPAPATRRGIGCAWITASPREVPLEETVGEGPETDSGELEACERALVDRAERSFYLQLKINSD
ncbi:hypothetical protein T09_12742 [Trichinella sp. T9]|nr:hypothetical protein T09_12742 [Trichinella sp. T9]